MSDVLARICATTREETARRRAATSQAALERRIAGVDRPRGFAAAVASRAPALIAEIKKASPSGGLIRPDFDPAALALGYQRAGAACLSVLTDAPYFQGAAEHLQAARAAAAVPILRKDFILEPWQVYESRAMGADCVLLIMAALSGAQAAELEQAAEALGMDVLVESHDRAELDRALRLRARLIGINNRNLKTLQTSLATAEELAPHVPADRIMVAESGIRTADDVRRLARVGARGFLVGESLLRQPDVEAATQALLQPQPQLACP